MLGLLVNIRYFLKNQIKTNSNIFFEENETNHWYCPDATEGDVFIGRDILNDMFTKTDILDLSPQERRLTTFNCVLDQVDAGNKFCFSKYFLSKLYFV